MSTTQTININTQVSVVLTGAGAAHLNRKYEGSHGIFNLIAGDVYHDTLWSLMHDFGDLMVAGRFLPVFKDNEINIR